MGSCRYEIEIHVGTHGNSYYEGVNIVYFGYVLLVLNLLVVIGILALTVVHGSMYARLEPSVVYLLVSICKRLIWC